MSESRKPIFRRIEKPIDTGTDESKQAVNHYNHLLKQRDDDTGDEFIVNCKHKLSQGQSALVASAVRRIIGKEGVRNVIHKTMLANEDTLQASFI